MTIDSGGPAFDLAARIRAARAAAQLDQQQLAGRVGVARNSISNWETGCSEPSATAFVALADALGVSVEWLAAGVRPESPAPAPRRRRRVVARRSAGSASWLPAVA